MSPVSDLTVQAASSHQVSLPIKDFNFAEKITHTPLFPLPLQRLFPFQFDSEFSLSACHLVKAFPLSSFIQITGPDVCFPYSLSRPSFRRISATRLLLQFFPFLLSLFEACFYIPVTPLAKAQDPPQKGFRFPLPPLLPPPPGTSLLPPAFFPLSGRRRLSKWKKNSVLWEQALR